MNVDILVDPFWIGQSVESLLPVFKNKESQVKLRCAIHLSEKLSVELSTEAQTRLVDAYIEQDLAGLGAGGARTSVEGVSVWVLIGYIEALDGDLERVARDYALPPDAVRAALLYFHRNPTVIAARIEENRLLRAD